MQHATSISAEEQNIQFGTLLSFGGGGGVQQTGEGQGGVFEIIKTGFGFIWTCIAFFFSCLSPSNIKEKYTMLSGMTIKEMFIGFLRLNFQLVLAVLTLLFTIVW